MDPLERPKPKRQLPNLQQAAQLLGLTQRRTRRSALDRILSVEEMRVRARKRVPRSIFDYVDGAAEEEITLRANRDAFQRLRFHPTALNDVSDPDTRSNILGDTVGMPLALAPTGFTRMVHREGEIGVAWAANRAEIPYTLATLGTASAQDICKVTPRVPRWFQLYAHKSEQANLHLLATARTHGFDTLVVTVDTAVIGSKRRDLRSGLTVPPTVSPRTFVDMAVHPRWWTGALTGAPLGFDALGSSGESMFADLNSQFRQGIDATFLRWIRTEWSGKLVIKGIVSPSDACTAFELGADGIVLSNHGGRQLDRTIPPVTALPAIRRAVGPTRTILLDSGIRSGADIVAALCLGADACMIGRPYLYGLMAGGAPGVDRVLSILRDDIVRTMRLLGVQRLSDLGPHHVSSETSPPTESPFLTAASSL
ncbi:alpha-hydroxy-acid oxidizing protein [Rhodococcus sp. NPDC057297]|uniref:alpha-hydroxy acid oxidase n=1 Tax=Rhodococcus sp. NPDC057297 TaxID=3346090 RepID=UPI00362DE4A4